MKLKKTFVATMAITSLLKISTTQAATFDWTGNTNTNFTEGTNWSQGSWAQWNDYRFGGTPTSATVTINDYFGYGSLSLMSGLTSDIVINTTGSPIVMGADQSSSSAAINIAADSRNLTINADYIASTAVTWNIGAGRTLTLNGALSNWYSTASLVKNGAGTATLTQGGSYTGGTTVNDGTLNLANGDWITGQPWNDSGATGTITVGAGALLSTSDGVTGIKNGLVLNGGTVSSRGLAYDGAWGNLFLLSDITAGGAAASFIASQVNLSGSRAITVGADSTLTMSGKINSWNSGGAGITKQGAGTLALSAANGYDGLTNINAGTLLVTNNAALGASGWSADNMTWVRSGATLALQGGVSINDHMHIFGSGVGGLGAIRSISGNNALTITYGDSGSGPGYSIDSNVTIGVDADSLTVTGFYEDGGSFGLTKAGNGALRITEASSYTGTTTINGGTLQIGNGGSRGSLYTPSVANGNLTFGSSAAIVNNGALAYNIAGGSVHVNRDISGTGTVSVTGDQAVHFADGTNITTNGSQTYSASATSGRYSGFNLADNATVNLTSTAGNISMTGMLGTANGNSGKLNINTSAGNGAVTLNTPAGIPGVDYGLDTLTVNAGTGSITLGTHNSENWYTINAISLTGGQINSSSNMTDFTSLTVSNSGASTFSGSLTANGSSLIKNGSGALTLSSNGNTFNGGITINGGTLVATRSTLGSGPVVINDGGTLRASDQWVLNSANPYNVAERNIGTLTINNGGRLELDDTNGFVNGVANLNLNGGSISGGPNDMRGDLYMYNGNQQITAGGATTSTIASVIGITGDNTITVTSGSALNITSTIKNSDWFGNGTTPGGIIKAGAGTLNLSGVNAYTGSTSVTGGTLQLNHRDALGAWRSKNLNISGGGTIVTNWGANDYNDLGTLNFGGNGIAGGTLRSNQVGREDLGNFSLYGNVNVAAGSTTRSEIASDVRVGFAETREFNVGTTSDASGVDLLVSGRLGHFNGNSWGYVNKTGSGTMKITGTNEIGGITVSAGKLILENAGIGGMFNSGLTNNAETELAVTGSNTASWGTNSFKGTGNFTKTDSGKLTLSSNNNTYTGSTTVSAGTLIINGNISTSTLTTVQSGATIGGSGTVGNLTVNAGAFINPGNSPGILNTGNYSQAGTLVAEITGITAGTQHDQINVTGSVTLSGALSLDTLNAGIDYVLNDMIFLILNDDTDAIVGRFSNYTEGANVGRFGGFDWVISYQADYDNGSFFNGNDVALMAIPEPSAALLGGLSALALLRRRRR